MCICTIYTIVSLTLTDQGISTPLHAFLCLGFYVTFNTVQVISQQGSFMGRGNQYIQLVKVLNCKLPTISKQLPTFQHKVQGLNLFNRPKRWETSVLSLRHHGPSTQLNNNFDHISCTCPFFDQPPLGRKATNEMSNWLTM